MKKLNQAGNGLIHQLGLLLLLLCLPCQAQQSATESQAEQVVKGLSDPASYRHLTLTNGLQVLLVSDDKFESAYASMSVKAGYYQDPEELPGLAHLYEHMLSKGSQKYPQAAEYKQFLADNGGLSKASTNEMRTNYFFQVNDEHFVAALDRFAWQFIAPTLSADMIYKERHAVDAEFRLKLADASRRKREVMRLQVNPQHPYHKFATGNLTTLVDQPNKSLHQYLQDFSKDYYCASRMALVLAAPQALDQLEKLASTTFSQIHDNCKRPLTNVKASALKPDSSTQLIGIKTLRDRRRLQLNFVLPTGPAYNNVLAARYAQWLLSSYNPRGVEQYLSDQNWALALNTSYTLLDEQQLLFSVEVRLKSEGWQQQSQVLAALLNYIELLRQHAADSPAYQHFVSLKSSEFDARSSHKDSDDIRALADRLLRYGGAAVLTSGNTAVNQDRAVLAAFFAGFTRDNLFIITENPQHEAQFSEPYYATGYRIDPLSWPEPTSPAQNFSLPSGSPYYVEAKLLEMPHPKRVNLIDEPKFSAWYTPKDVVADSYSGISIFIDTQSDKANFENYNDLYERRLKLQLKTVIDKAEQALIDVSTRQTASGLMLHLAGRSGNWPLLLKETLAAFAQSEIGEAELKLTLNQQKQAVTGSEHERLRTQAAAILNRQLGLSPSLAEFAKYREQFSERHYRKFVKAYLYQAHISAWYYGNFSAAQLQQMNQILQPLAGQITQPLAAAVQRWQPAVDAGLVRTKLAVKDSALHMVQFAPGQAVHDRLVIELTGAMMKAPFFHQLRTQEQLGYSISVTATHKHQHPYLQFYVQSPVKQASELLQRVVNFEQWFWQDLQQLDQQQFNALCDNLAASLKQSFLNSRSAESVRRSRLRDGLPDDYLEQLLSGLQNLQLDDFKAAVKVLLQQRPKGVLIDPETSD